MVYRNGAADRDLTDDLVLTKDVLYRLSYSSVGIIIFSGAICSVNVDSTVKSKKNLLIKNFIKFF